MTFNRKALLLIALALPLCMSAQEQTATPAPVVSKPAAKPAEKPAAPAPITQAEKDSFHRLYVEYLELQNKFATQVLSLKTQLENAEKQSNEEVAPKGQAIQQLFNSLSARCVSPKVFDRLSADCAEPPKK